MIKLIDEITYTCNKHVPNAILLMSMRGFRRIDSYNTDKPVDCNCGEPATKKLVATMNENNVPKAPEINKPELKRGFLIWIAIVVAFLNVINVFLGIVSFTGNALSFNVMGMIWEIFIGELLYVILMVIIANFVTVKAKVKKLKKSKGEYQ